jgi:hypothetical protein
MIKGKVYHTMTDSHAREKEAWFADVPDHVATFLRTGGKVYTAAIGESAYNPLKQHAFVINTDKHKTKQGWKEGKTK